MFELHGVYPDLNNQTFRLNIMIYDNDILSYLVIEIPERGLISKVLSKYIAAFEYFDKALIVLSPASDEISIPSYASVIGKVF